MLGGILLRNDDVQPRRGGASTPATSTATRTAASSRRWSSSTSAATPIDLITLKEALTRTAELEDVGGVAYIARLVDGVPRATNVEHYAQIVKEKSTLRALITERARDPAGGLRRRRGRRRDPRRRREAHLRGRRQADPQRLHPDRRPGAGELRHRSSKLQQHRGLVIGRADRVHRAGRDDGRPAAGRPGDHRGAAVDGQDQLRAEHRPARRAQPRAVDDGRLLQPGDVGGAAVHPPAHRPRRGSTRTACAAAICSSRRLRQAGRRRSALLEGARSSSTTPPRSASSRCAPRRGASRRSTASTCWSSTTSS